MSSNILLVDKVSEDIVGYAEASARFYIFPQSMDILKAFVFDHTPRSESASLTLKGHADTVVV